MASAETKKQKQFELATQGWSEQAKAQAYEQFFGTPAPKMIGRKDNSTTVPDKKVEVLERFHNLIEINPRKTTKKVVPEDDISDLAKKVMVKLIRKGAIAALKHIFHGK